ncbi:MAG: InlB B-repeat-containing protein [Oscillospiraceae bacterium]|nr:InlB B-repeat-containing protein [Oscillospiraceae bacterium]
MDEEAETDIVGLGIVPTHENPVKLGYTFLGWKDENNNITPVGTALPAATTDMSYTAQWEPISFNVSFAEGTVFDEDMSVLTTYDIDLPVTITPVKGGCTFDGWIAAQADENDTYYNWPDGIVTDTTGKYGDVILTPVWTVNADVVFADYAYAGNGNKLLLVGVNGIADGNALSYKGNPLFTTKETRYLALLNAANGTINGVVGNGKGATDYSIAYLYIIPANVTCEHVMKDLSIGKGDNQAVTYNCDVNRNGLFNSGDFGIVDDLLAQRESQADVLMRLEADVSMGDQEAYENQKFGTIDDIAAIIIKCFDTD